MDFINEEVMHKTFGKGNVVKFDDSYIEINFEIGDKKFIFPDAFKEYISFSKDEATKAINKKINEKEEKLIIEESILKKEKALEREIQAIMSQRERSKSIKINPSIQSVFWCEPNEEKDIFTEWKVFTGKIKSGERKGEPKLFPRMNHNSACLFTRMEGNMLEKDRKIVGLFMTNESFDGRQCLDGYITAHPEYRLRLSEEEAEKMLFWNYYLDEKFPAKTIWNSGKQRYFDNIWMAQILGDIVKLREKSKEEKEAQAFFEYFCKVNLIERRQLEEAKGALRRT